MTGDLDRLRSMLVDARRVAVFTGAGISTESGIPDFRSPGGIWSHTHADHVRRLHDVHRGATRVVAPPDRDRARHGRCTRPNTGHVAVARLVATGKVDRSHHAEHRRDCTRRQAFPRRRSSNFTANSTYAACLACDERHALDPILKAFREDGTIPQCRACGGIVKTATISFGQPMPADAMERARTAALSCDLFLAIGSSLVVWPAASLPAPCQAERSGPRHPQPRSHRPRPERRPRPPP